MPIRTPQVVPNPFEGILPQVQGAQLAPHAQLSPDQLTAPIPQEAPFQQADQQEAERTEAIKAKVREVAESGQLEDGRGGFNFKALLSAIAPLLGAGVGAGIGAIAGGKSGASKGLEAGLAGGVGFSQGFQQREQRNIQDKFKQGQLDLLRTRTEAAAGASAATQGAAETRQRLLDLQIQEQERRLGEDPEVTAFLERPTGTLEEINAAIETAKIIKSDDPRFTSHQTYLETLQRAMSGPKAITSDFMRDHLRPIIDQIDSGVMLSHAGEQEALAAASGLDMDSAIREFFVAQRIKDTRLPVNNLDGTQRKQLTDSAFVVSQANTLIEIASAPEMRELLNRFTAAKVSVDEGLNGFIDPELRPIANKLRLLVENYGRSRSGAVIGEEELKNFAAQTGRLGLTQDELLGRLMSLREDAEARVSSIIQPLRANQVGWETLGEAQQQQLIRESMDAQLPGFELRSLARQIVDHEEAQPKVDGPPPVDPFPKPSQQFDPNIRTVVGNEVLEPNDPRALAANRERLNREQFRAQREANRAAGVVDFRDPSQEVARKRAIRNQPATIGNIDLTGGR